MKKVFYLFCVACLALAFTSCEKEEQSSLNLKNAPKGTVSGYVYTNKGFNPDTVINVPVANQTFTVYVDLSDFDSEAQGTKTYTVTTDANGFYSIELPSSYVNEIEIWAEVQFKDTYAVPEEYPVGSGTYVAKNVNAMYSGYNSDYVYPDYTTIMNIFVTMDDILDPDYIFVP